MTLTTIHATDISPWLILSHVDIKILEVEDDNHDPARPGDIDDDEEEGEGTTVSAETGFVSLAIGESSSLATDRMSRAKVSRSRSEKSIH